MVGACVASDLAKEGGQRFLGFGFVSADTAQESVHNSAAAVTSTCSVRLIKSMPEIMTAQQILLRFLCLSFCHGAQL